VVLRKRQKNLCPDERVKLSSVIPRKPETRGHHTFVHLDDGNLPNTGRVSLISVCTATKFELLLYSQDAPDITNICCQNGTNIFVDFSAYSVHSNDSFFSVLFDHSHEEWKVNA
jgi:hypothetical protein